MREFYRLAAAYLSDRIGYYRHLSKLEEDEETSLYFSDCARDYEYVRDGIADRKLWNRAIAVGLDSEIRDACFS